ncbi:RIMS-binding protein 2 isoform X10 [Bactrocera neohumeralis]|uniref:RIMS-binding protein 2 isoform X10 n=1 Tax=Bactrocera neohumeralis TaxID=98809 RepID=UPI0021663078|nr:RIMS-binding protein 2 isoform X10 [Bactrocera neohumeralis]
MPYESMHHHQSSAPNGMLDSLSLQLRDAEMRRTEIERAHQETLAQIRNMSSSSRPDTEAVENLQSRARELEKKVALENVRCEELQIELTSALKAKAARSGGSDRGNYGGISASSANASSAAAISGTSSTVTWAPTISHQDQGSEIDIIMAKIEQDNRVLAELEQPRTSAKGMSSMPTSSILNNTNSEFQTISKNELEEELNRYKRAVLGGTSGTAVGSSALTSSYGTAATTGAGGLPSSLTSTLPNGASAMSAALVGSGGSGGVGVGVSAGGGSSVGSGGGSGGSGPGGGGGGGGVMGLSSISALVPNSIGGISSSLSSHAIQSMNTAASAYGAGPTSVEKLLSGTSGIAGGIPPLPVNIHTMKSMPSALSQRGTIQLYNLQSTTMPILSLNAHNIPTGTSSYSALGLSGAGTVGVPSLGSSLTHPALGNMLDTSTLLGTTGLSGLSGVGGASSLYGLGAGPGIGGLSGITSGLPNSYVPPFIDVGSSTSYPYSSAALRTATKMKMLDEIDIPLTRYGNRSSPCSPIPPSTWGLDEFTDGLSASMLHNRGNLALGALDLETRNHNLNGVSEPQVDMLDIPGKGRCCVFIARFPYDPPEEAEGELSLCAGDYLLVWTSGEPQGGYLDAELLDGRRGLVPASFVQRLIGDDLLEFHQAVLSTLRDAEDGSMQCDTTSLPSLPPHNPLLTHTQEDLARLSETHTDLEHDQDDISDNVPAPKHLTLERQLNKSVLIGWSPPEPVGYNLIDSYHVYVDGVLKVTVKANERTRALIEGVDSNRPHRISVRSVTQNRQTSRDAACTMIIGRDTSHLGPSAVRASHITCSSAVISWLPANSNHQHVVCVNNVEVRTVKPGVYRHTITGLAPSTQYRVTVRAKHLRAAGGQPTPGRPQEEAPGAYADFRTLTKGLPDPPQDIQLEAGPQDGTILVTWQPVNRPTSSGPVTGYAVYADGKKVTDINSPTGDHALIDIGKLGVFNPRAVTIRTKSRDAQSADSAPILIPNTVRSAVGRRGPQQMGMGPQQMQPGTHGMPGQMNMPGQPLQQQQHMMGQDPNQYDPNQQMQHGQQQQTGQQQGQPGQQPDGSHGLLGGLLGGLFSKPTTQSQVNQNVNGYQPGTGQRPMMQGRPPGPQMMGGQQPGQQPYGPQGQMGAQQRFPGQRGPAPGQMQGQMPGQLQGQMQGQGQMPGQMQGQIAGQMQGQMPIQMQGQMAGQMQGAMGPRGPLNPQQQMQQQQQQHQQQQQQQGQMGMGPGQQPLNQQQQQLAAQKKPRYFVAMFDYDPSTMSPNPDGCDEELPFQEGDTIKVYGDKDADGFYWGELRGRRGYVPHNMVTEVDDGTGGMGPMPGGPPQPGGPGQVMPGQGGPQQSMRNVSRDRWGDIYANMPVKRMIALYDYDPQELSPNVDAEQVELSFKTGEVILVYGDMDEDGFYMGELDGIRGLVPSNFLAEAPDQYNNQMGPAGRGGLSQRGRGQGPGARGPPPPPRDNMMPGMTGQRGSIGKIEGQFLHILRLLPYTYLLIMYNIHIYY